jgi:putative aminopeptidase FrvX
MQRTQDHEKGKTMDLIEDLCTTYGPAGREHLVRKRIEKELKGVCPEIYTDRLGNLIAHQPPVRSAKGTEKIMLCAHMDEIGLIVTYIDTKGFLRFASVGGVFPELALNQRVVFENGTLGIIGVEPEKDKSKSQVKPHLDKMYIDIGVHDQRSAEKMVQVGDVAAFSQQAVWLSDNRIVTKALDDRIGCYCLIETAKRVKKTKHDLYYVFSVQEEVGLRGARTGAFAVAPKYALAVDVTDTGDTPEAHRMQVSVGKGVAIKIKDSMFLANPLVKDKLVAYAKSSRVPYQLEILEHGTTDAAVIQLVKEGVMSGVLSIPTRYVHSTNELCDLNDVESAIRILSLVCQGGLS